MVYDMKPIPGYEDKYLIDKNGRILSLPKKGGINSFGGLLKPKLGDNGYYSVYLFGDKNKTHYSVHRLVALTFIKNPENKNCVNHKDGNKINNNVKNLEWVTHSENLYHSYHTLGNKYGHEKKLGMFNRIGELLDTFCSVKEGAYTTGLSSRAIANCARGEAKTSGGFIWKYI